MRRCQDVKKYNMPYLAMVWFKQPFGESLSCRQHRNTEQGCAMAVQTPIAHEWAPFPLLHTSPPTPPSWAPGLQRVPRLTGSAYSLVVPFYLSWQTCQRTPARWRSAGLQGRLPAVWPWVCRLHSWVKAGGSGSLEVLQLPQAERIMKFAISEPTACGEI